MARLKAFESRGENRNFDVYEDIDRIPEYRVDGLFNLMVGPSDSKLVFYSTRNLAPADDRSGNAPVEIRDVNIKLSMSTRVLLENCVEILNNVKTNQSSLSAGRRAEDQKITEILDKIQQLVDKRHQH